MQQDLLYLGVAPFFNKGADRYLLGNMKPAVRVTNTIEPWSNVVHYIGKSNDIWDARGC
jgi:hypothetical protein